MKIINEWDPIRVFPLAPKDEYFQEVKEIEGILQRKAISVEELAIEIHRIFLDAFGKDLFKYTLEECNTISKKIMQLDNMI